MKLYSSISSFDLPSGFENSYNIRAYNDFNPGFQTFRDFEEQLVISIALLLAIKALEIMNTSKTFSVDYATRNL